MVISIGYAACHWCHVMEHESFEDEEVARAMNNHFISVKVDREERPDLDAVYMAAAYATTGRGGWPLNVIALPDQRPVFGGTYFRKKDWLYILDYYAGLWEKQPDELRYQASQIAQGMNRHFRIPQAPDDSFFSENLAGSLFTRMQPDLDEVNGGTHGAPKFPMPVHLRFLLDFGIRSGHQAALDHTRLTLDRMFEGGIYDHLGGGFSRYSVDASWHVPHFEKMLYDNAQLISLYAKAYRFFRNEKWEKVVEETIAFAEKELMRQDGLFYASLDADSEGKEGAYYAWTEAEIRKTLGDHAEAFLSHFSCSAAGNWENGENVLRIAKSEQWKADKAWLNQMLEVREKRARPATDDKILTGWNALMICGLVDAWKTFGHEKWLRMAETTAGFYLDRLSAEKGKLWRNSKNNDFSNEAYLDDYGLLMAAFLELYQATFGEKWLAAAEMLNQQVLSHFSSKEGPFFNLVSDEVPALVIQPVELSDNVIPASNSVMAHNLVVLGHILENQFYISRAEQMLAAMLPHLQTNPAFHANWARLLLRSGESTITVKIIAEDPFLVRKVFFSHVMPGVIWSAKREAGVKREIFICKGKTCFTPVESVEEALRILGK
jgi:uncharacterized protein YyaL (SSP411 family)